MKQSQDFEIKLTIKCLENILSKEENAERDRIQGIIKKLEQSRNMQHVKSLNQQQTQFINLLTEGYYGYRQALNDLMRLEKYKILVDTKFDGAEYLLNLQPFINIDKSNLTLENLFGKYTVHLLKFKKTHENLPKEFMQEWTTKAKEKVAENNKKKEVKKLPLKPPESQAEYEESEQQESEVAPPPPPRSSQPKGRENQGRDRQRQQQKERQLEKARELQKERQLMRERANKKVQPQQQQQQPQRVENVRELKNKINLIQKYLLENRKDLHISGNKLREISQHLASLMENFMRDTMFKLISIAKLKNRKNPRLGSELSYFALENQRITANFQKSFHVQPNTKIFANQYKNKLEIYTTHRIKEFRKEDDIRQALQIKTSQFQKRVDKKVETYILKPRCKDAEAVAIYREDKEYPRSNIVSINIEHVLYFLNNHQFLRNSFLIYEIYYN